MKVRVADPRERAIMAQIVRWHMDGHGWDSITAHLKAQGVPTKHGTAWSRSRVIRAFHAELRLQSSEARGSD